MKTHLCPFPTKDARSSKTFLKKDPNTKLRESGSRATDFFSPGGGKQKGGEKEDGKLRKFDLCSVTRGKEGWGGKEFVHGKLLNSAPLLFFLEKIKSEIQTASYLSSHNPPPPIYS